VDDQAFKSCSADALDDLFDRLTTAGEQHGFEADFNGGALTVEFEDPPAKFVVSPNSPVKQIWVSAHSKSFKFDWDAAREAFVLPATRQTLSEMMSEAISQQLGASVKL
jgi:iron donor protein CyaY